MARSRKSADPKPESDGVKQKAQKSTSNPPSVTPRSVDWRVAGNRTIGSILQGGSGSPTKLDLATPATPTTRETVGAGGLQRKVTFGNDFVTNHEVVTLNTTTAASKYRSRGAPVNSTVEKKEVEKSGNYTERNLKPPVDSKYDFSVQPPIDVIKARKVSNKIKLDKYEGPILEGYREGKDKNVTHLASGGTFKEDLGKQDLIDPAIAAAAAAAVQQQQAQAAQAAKKDNESRELRIEFRPHKKKTQARKTEVTDLIKAKATELQGNISAQKSVVTIRFETDGQALALSKAVPGLLEGLTYGFTTKLA